MNNTDAPADTIGILMLDTEFERLPGDIGNPITWPFPVSYRIVEGCTPAEIITLETANPLQAFLDGADDLIAEGVIGITTTCGFLGYYQHELANHSSVPVASSALLQLPMVERLLPAKQRAGILTYNADALSKEHLQAVGVAGDTAKQGFAKDSIFYRWIMEGLQDVPLEDLCKDVVNAALTLKQQNPDIGAIISECTNLTPFAHDIRLQTGLPVFDTVSMVHWFYNGLRPRRFDG